VAPVPRAGELLVGVRDEGVQAGGGSAKMVRKQVSSSRAQGQVSGILTLLCVVKGSGSPSGLSSAAAPLPLLGVGAPAVRVGLPPGNQGSPGLEVIMW
jgi:hypothetical protein